MKKLLLLTLLLFSSLAQAEWIVLSCVDKDSSVIVEFDEAAQKVRYQNDNKRIYPAKITEYTIKWSEMGSIQGGGGFMVNFYLD